jgi:hypothetical protein
MVQNQSSICLEINKCCNEETRISERKTVEGVCQAQVTRHVEGEKSQWSRSSRVPAAKFQSCYKLLNWGASAAFADQIDTIFRSG